jgi:hypothetical protein
MANMLALRRGFSEVVTQASCVGAASIRFGIRI